MQSMWFQLCCLHRIRIICLYSLFDRLLMGEWSLYLEWIWFMFSIMFCMQFFILMHWMCWFYTRISEWKLFVFRWNIWFQFEVLWLWFFLQVVQWTFINSVHVLQEWILSCEWIMLGGCYGVVVDFCYGNNFDCVWMSVLLCCTCSSI